MKRRDYEDYIRDIYNSILDIEEFILGMDYPQFSKDKKTILAVVRSFEIIGEAVKNIPKETKDKYNEIPWKAISGMRDKLIHEYFGTDTEVLWVTMKDDIPSLKEVIGKILKEYP